MPSELFYSSIILHVPHSGTVVPESMRSYLNDVLPDFRTLARPLIDYYTDELFIPEVSSDSIISLVFPYSRVFCDVERLPHDPLEKKGLGIMYDCCWDGQSSAKEGCRRISYRLYEQHQRMLADKIMDLAEGSIPLMIDCHSFSALPNRLCSHPGDVDICIGFNDDWSKPKEDVIELVLNHFMDLGYKVGVNSPFSNAKTVDIPFAYHSLMIEVSKSLYMDEDTLERSDGFLTLKHGIETLYGRLLRCE